MRRLYYLSVIGIVLLAIACHQKKEDKVNKEKIDDDQEVLKIITSKDTIAINEPLRCLAHLKSPFFKDKDTEIMVFLDHDENKTLKKDLSNIYGLVMAVFTNLKLDTINQKWFAEDKYSYNTTVAFGRTFSSPGKKKIRGYILEYYDQDPRVLVDSIVEEDKIKRYYFEREIYVTDIDSISN